MNKSRTVTEHIFKSETNEFSYKLIVSKRAKNLQMNINQQGDLQVIIPHRLRSIDHLSFIKSKTEWISKHIKQDANSDFYFFGNKIDIRPHYDMFNSKITYSIINNQLNINIPVTETRTLHKLFHNWLFDRAKIILTERVKNISEKYNFSPLKISIRRQKTRWGSCSGKGTISLNYKLLMLRQELIDYIIIHELCHLHEMNHSKAFWLLVGKILPHYQILKKELRQLRL